MRVMASCEGFPTLQRKWGGSGRSEGVLRHCPRRTGTTRSSRFTRSSSPSHCQSNNRTLQLLLRQHPPSTLPNPPSSYLFSQPLPATPHHPPALWTQGAVTWFLSHTVELRHGGFALQMCLTKVNIFMAQKAARDHRSLQFSDQSSDA